MSGEPPPVSGSPYIIICSSRTELLAAKSSAEKIVAVNRGAAQLCSFMETQYSATPTDFLEISNLQHELMDGLEIMDKDTVDAKCKEMVGLFYQLERKYDDSGY